LRAYRDEGWLKDDLVAALDDHLRANAPKLSSKSSFNEFYQRTSSPTKRETKVPLPGAEDAEPKPRKRRQTKVKEEIENLYVQSKNAPRDATTRALTRSRS